VSVRVVANVPVVEVIEVEVEVRVIESDIVEKSVVENGKNVVEELSDHS
jgi:hypothetical protein